MKKQKILSLCLASLLALSLAACNSQADEQDSTPPTVSVQPSVAPTPTPEPTPEPTSPIPYTDVAEDSPYYDAIVWAYENGITSGGSTFEPDSACTRGQVITFIWRAMGSPEPWIMENPFSDASPDAWYYKPALWAYQHNVATSTTVNPGNPCTNAEALTFLWRAEGKPDKLTTLAASGTYYGQPVAWAEKNGLFAQMGAAFDPSTPCSRAYLMSYLHWAEEQWIPSEEDKTVQAEYEYILNSEEPFTNYRGGLCYADYVDVDGDGMMELLTVSASGDKGYHTYDVTATVYANTNGHAGKLCEQTFSWEWMTESLSICKIGNQMCLWSTWEHMGTASVGDVFYTVENGAFVISESVSVSYASQEPEYNGITEAGYKALSQKYTGKMGLLYYHRNDGLSVQNQGIAPSWEEYYGGKYWTAYWETSDPMYAAVLRGDFSAIAGNYEGGYYDPDPSYGGEEVSATISEDGIATGAFFMVGDEGKALAIRVRESGEIRVRTGYDKEMDYEFGYTIYPPGCAADLPVKDEPSIMRISYRIGSAGSFAFLTPVS